MNSGQRESEPSDSAQVSRDLPSYCFPKPLRLLNAEDYTQVFDDAPFRASHPNFLILSRTSSCENARLGLIIAKKNVNKANQRNRIKRLLRESFRLQQHNLAPIDAIVLARKGADTLTNAEITIIINGLWKRVNKRARTTK